MATKPKTFRCVEMKHKSQAALLAEFQKRRDEFPTLAQFLATKAKESEWVAKVWSKFDRKQS